MNSTWVIPSDCVCKSFNLGKINKHLHWMYLQLLLFHQKLYYNVHLSWFQSFPYYCNFCICYQSAKILINHICHFFIIQNCLMLFNYFFLFFCLYILLILDVSLKNIPSKFQRDVYRLCNVSETFNFRC